MSRGGHRLVDMTATGTHWGDALFTMIGLPACYFIGVLLLKNEKHGDRVRAKPKAQRRIWDKPWVGSPPKVMRSKHDVE